MYKRTANTILALMTVTALIDLSGCWLPVASEDENEDENGDENGDESEDENGDENGDESEDGLDLPEENPTWAEIRCTENMTGGTLCYALPPDSDAWVLVTRDCDIDVLEADGVFEPRSAWDHFSCAAGEHPTAFPDYRCELSLIHNRVVCFGGGDGWLTQVDPACSASGEALEAWGSWCDDTAEPGPWSLITCPSSEGAPCRGWAGADVFAVWPSCYVDSLPEANAEAC